MNTKYVQASSLKVGDRFLMYAADSDSLAWEVTDQNDGTITATRGTETITKSSEMVYKIVE